MTDLSGRLVPGHRPGGIHRVVLEFANAGALVARARGISLICGCYDEVEDTYLRFDPHYDDQAGDHRPFDWIHEGTLFQHGQTRPINRHKLDAKYSTRPIKRRLQGTLAALRLLRRRMTGRLIGALRSRAQAERLDFRRGDIFLMLGSGWDALPVFDYILPLKAAGIITPQILVHDLTPLIDINVEPTMAPAVFSAWLDKASRLADGLLTYSASTRNDLIRHLAKSAQRVPPVSVVTLPHEFPAPAETPLSQSVREVLGTDYALFVGAIRGRKNAPRLLQAWAQVLSRLGPERTPLLVITDRGGEDEVYDTHIRPIASHVRLLDRPTDYELSRLYSAAAFTVFPSLYEGWGLPVGESLWHGVPCITSDASSLPEVGGPLCDYVDPTSIDSIASAVERFAVDRDYRNSRARAIRRESLRTWRDFASGTIDAALANAGYTFSRDDAELPEAGAPVLPASPHELRMPGR